MNQEPLHVMSLYYSIHQDSEGKTPLHSAIFSQQWRSTCILLEAGADATLVNHTLFTPLHNTMGFGFLA